MSTNPQDPLEADLIDSASSGNTEKVLELLANPLLNPNCFDTNQFTPLNCATWYGRIDTMVEMLKIGEPPLFCAVQRRNPDAIRVLSKHPRVHLNMRKEDGATSFLYAAQEGFAPELLLLLEVPQLDVNIGLNDGASPLFLACQNGHMEVVKIILALGKDVNAGKTWGDRSPAEHARSKGFEEIAVLLEKFVADGDNIRWSLRRELGATSKRFTILLFPPQLDFRADIHSLLLPFFSFFSEARWRRRCLRCW